MTDPQSAVAMLGGSGAAIWLIRALLQRAVAQIDGSLLRVESRITTLEVTQRDQGETLAIVAHELGVRNRRRLEAVE